MNVKFWIVLVNLTQHVLNMLQILYWQVNQTDVTATVKGSVFSW